MTLRQKEKRPYPRSMTFAVEAKKVDHDAPTSKDVLYGRGYDTNKHEGNKAFCLIIQDYKPVYATSDARTKRAIADAIYDKWISNSGRFRKYDGSKYVCVGKNEAVDRILYALRQKETINNWDLSFPQDGLNDLLETTETSNSKKSNRRIPTIIIPEYITAFTSKDVLFGRGHGSSMFEGNIAFREFLKPYKQMYQTYNQRDKRKLAGDVYEKWISESGRFIKQEGTNWVSVYNKEDIMDKIYMCLRQKEKADKPATGTTGRATNMSSRNMSVQDLSTESIISTNLHPKNIIQNKIDCDKEKMNKYFATHFGIVIPCVQGPPPSNLDS